MDPRTRNFLLKSSLLRSMNDALIVRVTGEENGQMQLEEIERQGLFLQRMDDSGEWFRYHPLFGNFLRQRCQWELAVELPEIHRAAAESWMAQGFPSEAIHRIRPRVMQKCCAIFCSATRGACLTTAN